MSRLIVLLSFAAGVFGADLTGHWEAFVKAGAHEFPLHIELKQSGGTLTGSFGQRDDFLWPLTGVAINGDQFTFALKLPSGPEATFQGTVTENTAAGQLTSTAPGLNGAVAMKKVGPPLLLPSPLAPRTSTNLSSLSDEFSRAGTLARWKTLGAAEDLPERIGHAEVSKAAPGYLKIVPKSAAWWGGYHGAFLFKEVTGDFVVTTRLNVSGNGGSEPSNIWTLSGLLVRAPGDGKLALQERKENWVYLMTGRGPAEGRVVDAKSTRNSVNAWDITPARPGWHELRIARIGPVFLLLCRPDGADWGLRKVVVRDDLPATLQVGINLTSDFKLSASMPAAKYNAEVFEGKSTVDATTVVDWIRFAPVPDQISGLAGKPLLDVSEAEVLRLIR